MNVILPRYAGAIAESVVNDPVELDTVESIDDCLPALAVIDEIRAGIGIEAGQRLAHTSGCFVLGLSDELQIVSGTSVFRVCLKSLLQMILRLFQPTLFV